MGSQNGLLRQRKLAPSPVTSDWGIREIRTRAGTSPLHPHGCGWCDRQDLRAAETVDEIYVVPLGVHHFLLRSGWKRGNSVRVVMCSKDLVILVGVRIVLAERRALWNFPDGVPVSISG